MKPCRDVLMLATLVAVHAPLAAGSTLDSLPVSSEAVVWTRTMGVSVSGNSLLKQARTRWGNAGASSTKSLTSGDGHVEFTASESSTLRILGISGSDPNQTWQTIAFALYLNAGQLEIYEQGVSRGAFGTYSQGDVLRVAVESGAVKYRRNGILLYTSPVAPTYPLLVDTALYTAGATLTGAVVSGEWAVPQGSPADPVILFTDVEAGPIRGGPGDRGVPISLFGKGFGAQRGTSTVTINGVEVASYLTWGQNNANNSALDMIVVQPGPSATAGPIVVHVNGRDSAPDHSFTPTTGSVY